MHGTKAPGSTILKQRVRKLVFVDDAIAKATEFVTKCTIGSPIGFSKARKAVTASAVGDCKPVVSAMGLRLRCSGDGTPG